MQLTEEKIFKLAPDSGTAQRAREVAHFRRWHLLAGNGRAIWGEYGNPYDPFLVAADFEKLAVHCTCPVRRKPCKHGIGLLLTFLRYNGEFSVQEPPDWVQSWLDKRDRRFAKKKEEKPQRSAEAEAALAEQRQRNRERRMADMAAGLDLLENWVLDLLRQGLASLEGREEDYFQELATRMVDAKLGTLARRIRQLPQVMTLDDWPSRLSQELGEIYLLVKAFQKLPTLPDALQDDLLSLTGVNFKKEDILANAGITDRWLVAGQFFAEEDSNLQSRRTWLIGEQSGRIAMLLDFSWGGTGYESDWRSGSILDGEVVFYPSRLPLRALVKAHEVVKDQPFHLPEGLTDFKELGKKWAAAVGTLPWVWPWPAILDEVIPVHTSGRFLLVDKNRDALPLACTPQSGWQLMAESAGMPIRIFGQWEGEAFRPLSVVADVEVHFL
ncbi:MAG: hypothetical protein CMN32_15030 [Saprospirales bacterium]|nr:hypothetical protein [Saprospirales bacterium]